MKILIIRLSSIGDCVLASPVVEALRERYPATHISWLVQPKSLTVVSGLPGLSDTLVWDDRQHPTASLLTALGRVWRAHFDVVLDLQGTRKVGLFMLAARLSGTPRRISGTSSKPLALWCSNERAPESERLHARFFYLRRAAQLDIAPDAPERFYPRVPVCEEHRQFARDFLAAADFHPEHRLIGFNLGASRPQNRWPCERFARLAHALLADDDEARIITFGAAADAPLMHAFEAAFEAQLPVRGASEWRERVLSGVGRLNLLQLAAVTERCSAFVTADTGPMHIAAAVGAPVLALFGPADSRLTGPVHQPGRAPIRVLAAREVTGSWPAPMEALEVDAVRREVQAIMAETATLGVPS